MIQPYPYQDEAEQSIFDYFAKGYVGNPLVCMPTGTGKSLVIAFFIRHVMQMWPSQRIMVLTHVKELIKNNASELRLIWPGAPIGIYSAGLDQRDTRTPIVFGGVQSVVKKINEFGHRDLLLIDEAHLLGPKVDSIYGKTIEGLKLINPKLKVIGFTATPYRQGQGQLTEGDNPLFTDVCFNNTGFREFLKLIDDGYLKPLISKRTVAQVNLNGVGIGSDGDYSKGELEAAMDTQSLNYQVCKEMVQYGQDRRSWLVFAAGIKHAEHIAELLRSFGIATVAVHSKMGDSRDKAIEDFKSGKIRCIVNNNVLTTGFNHRPTDFIGMLRPTTSTGLWVQMLGRGTRPSPETGKTDCLVLDFAGNTVRLGPINDPLIPKRKGSRDAPGVPPIKICPFCSVYNYATAQTCCNCGERFPERESKLDNTAAVAELIRRDSEQNPAPQIERYEVERVIYRKYVPKDKPALLKVSYIVKGSPLPFSEIVCLENTTSAKNLAAKWWKSRMGSDQAPPSVDEALKWSSLLAVPTAIRVHINKKYPEVVGVEGLRR
jgi:DNA repair protein RadD